MIAHPIRILLVDDDGDDNALACSFLASSVAGLRTLSVRVVQTWKEARLRIVLDALDVIVMRHCVRDATVSQMLSALYGLPHSPVIVVAPDGAFNCVVDALRGGADECVTKTNGDWYVDLRNAIERVTHPCGPQLGWESRPERLGTYASLLAHRVVHARAAWAGSVFDHEPGAGRGQSSGTAHENPDRVGGWSATTGKLVGA